MFLCRFTPCGFSFVDLPAVYSAALVIFCILCLRRAGPSSTPAPLRLSHIVPNLASGFTIAPGYGLSLEGPSSLSPAISPMLPVFVFVSLFFRAWSFPSNMPIYHGYTLSHAHFVALRDAEGVLHHARYRDFVKIHSPRSAYHGEIGFISGFSPRRVRVSLNLHIPHRTFLAKNLLFFYRGDSPAGVATHVHMRTALGMSLSSFDSDGSSSSDLSSASSPSGHSNASSSSSVSLSAGSATPHPVPPTPPPTTCVVL